MSAYRIFAARSAHAASRSLVLVILLALLSACGGGDYDLLGPPPDIALTTSVTDARRGDVVQLSAAVTASNGVDYVSFYRIDYGQSVLLGSVIRPPARWETVVPFNAGSSVTYFARVCDLEGYCTSSYAQTVWVYP